MEYDKLSKVFYKKGSAGYEAELKRRLESYGSYLTSLNIRGFQRGESINEHYRLFYVNIHELASLNNRVLLNSSRISLLISKLPEFVVEPYFHMLIVNEAQSSNEIEGIRSTKKELKEALGGIGSQRSRRRRFEGLMKTYLFIDKVDPFREVSDFRRLYDELVLDEIDESDSPDEELFRKGYVEIGDGTKVSHIGVSSEAKITECLEELIGFLEDDRHLELYRYMIAHYYYEYIHPFYDGNGRTGRLMVCSYLSRYLEKYSAITFSYAINQNKSKYYKALQEIPYRLNRGEATFYLVDMLELLSAGQEDVIDDLEINLAKIETIDEYFKGDGWMERGDEALLLKGLTYFEVFTGDEGGILAGSLEDMFGISRYKLNKTADRLLEEGLIEQTNRRPKKYRISGGLLADILGM